MKQTLSDTSDIHIRVRISVQLTRTTGIFSSRYVMDICEVDSIFSARTQTVLAIPTWTVQTASNRSIAWTRWGMDERNAWLTTATQNHSSNTPEITILDVLYTHKVSQL